MAYEPNYSDPRVIKRCKRALAYTLAYAKPRTPRPLSTRDIALYFGQDQNQLSNYLRKMLLIEHDSRYSSLNGKCKRYLRNTDGCHLLQRILDPDIPYETAVENIIHDHVCQWEPELTTGDFQYKDKSHRQWHPLQNLDTPDRQRELNRYGYSHIYDIKCAAPSIILYLARDLGIKLKHTHTICDYIQHRTEIRQVLSTQLGISLSDTKRLINMLFNGCPIAHSNNYVTYAVAQHLHNDWNKIEAVKNNSYIQSLRAEIRKCWQKISNHQVDGVYIMQRTYHPDGRKKRVSSRDRWNLYFLYERCVMDAVTGYLDKQMARYFIEHDGWSCDIEIDLLELENHVRNITGIDTIQFEYEYYKKGI